MSVLQLEHGTDQGSASWTLSLDGEVTIGRPAKAGMGKLAKIRSGDSVKLGGSSFKVRSAERTGKLIHLKLQDPDGGRSTLIGVPGARIASSHSGSSVQLWSCTRGHGVCGHEPAAEKGSSSRAWVGNV